MIPIREKERRAARRLADSGRCSNWRAVEAALRAREQDEARLALAPWLLRLELNIRCRLAAWGRRAAEQGPRLLPLESGSHDRRSRSADPILSIVDHREADAGKSVDPAQSGKRRRLGNGTARTR